MFFLLYSVLISFKSVFATERIVKYNGIEDIICHLQYWYFTSTLFHKSRYNLMILHLLEVCC